MTAENRIIRTRALTLSARKADVSLSVVRITAVSDVAVESTVGAAIDESTVAVSSSAVAGRGRNIRMHNKRA
jgi:hypothetical protein